MKKRLAVVLSAIMALTMFGGQFAFAASGDQFTDVPSDAWYKPDVDYVAENDYMIGTSDTTFEPQSNLTRAMFATILARYDGAEVDDSVPTIFTDVEVNQWFTGSIGWANDKKIVEGRGDNIFDPTSFITRQELAVMVERYITYVESTTDKVHVTPGVAIPFTDADQISDYAKDAMDKAVIHGLIIGYPDKSVKPLQNITRAETAAVIHRIKWKTRDGRENYTLTYQDYEGNVIATVDVPVGQLVEIGKDITNPEGPEGTTFVGWQYTAPDGTVTTYHPGDKIQLSDDMVLVPVFSDGKESHDITLIDAVNDSEISKTTVPSGETFTIPAGPEKSGYTFKEWNTQKDGKGTTYKPESTIELVSDMTLYAIYTKKSSGGGGGGSQTYYTVTASLEAANAGPYTLTAKYTEDQAKAKTVGQIADDLLKDYTDAKGTVWNNEMKLSNLMEAAIVLKAQDRGPKQFGNYVVKTTEDGLIHVDGINLVEKLQAEDDFYKTQMAEVRTLSKLDRSDLDGTWNAYVEATYLSNLFVPQGEDLELLTTDGYVAVFKKAVKALTDLQNQIGDKAAYLEFLNAYENAIGTSPLDINFGTNGGSYELLGQAFKSPVELSPINDQIATIFEGGNSDVILDLMKGKNANESVTVFSGKENVTGTKDVVAIVKDRISRNWENRDDIQSVLDALTEAYSGSLSVKVVVTKTQE